MKRKNLVFKQNGDFASPNSEPLARKMIGVRLPESLDPLVRQIAGDDLSGWIRQAILEKLDRETSPLHPSDAVRR